MTQSHTPNDEIEKLFFRIFDQDDFPTLKGNYQDYLRFKELAIILLGKAKNDWIKEVLDILQYTSGRQECIDKIKALQENK